MDLSAHLLPTAGYTSSRAAAWELGEGRQQAVVQLGAHAILQIAL